MNVDITIHNKYNFSGDMLPMLFRVACEGWNLSVGDITYINETTLNVTFECEEDYLYYKLVR